MSLSIHQAVPAVAIEVFDHSSGSIPMDSNMRNSACTFAGSTPGLPKRTESKRQG